MKILAIGAHPDDIEIFMYGFISICKEEGHTVNITIATDGSKGGVDIDKNLAHKRKNEAIEGLKLLGTPSFLNLPDGELGSSSNHYQIIKENIYRIEPDLILTHHKKDYHSDHVNLSKLVKKIVSHYTPVLYCDTMMGINFKPDYYIDISNHFLSKINSIMCHKSQNPKRFSNLITLMNSYRAAQCNAPIGCYAEAYSFESSFPFSDIRNLLPQGLKIRPFHIDNVNGFL